MIHVRLNLDNINASSTLPTLFEFLNCRNLKNNNGDFTKITINPSLTGDFLVTYADSTNIWYTRTDIKNISSDQTYVEFDCDMTLEEDDIKSLMNQNILVFDTGGYTSIFCYRLNNERDYLEKDLIFVDILSGTFKAPLGIKNIELDVVNYDIDYSYNYAYIPRLKRYYYINNIGLVNKDFTRLQLQEDVLMTWKTLIKSQRALITRYENSTEWKLVDNRRPMEDVPTIEYGTITNTNNGLVNCTLNFSVDPANLMYMISSISAEYPALSRNPIVAPTGSDLPNVDNIFSNTERVVFLNQSGAGLFYESIAENSAVASYISSVILLPFKVDDSAYNPLSNSVLYAGKYVLTNSGFYEVGHIPEGSSVVTLPTYSKNGSPYFVVYDFEYDLDDDYYFNMEPFTHVEFFIPFIGWVPLQIKHILNKRLIVYYTLDHITASGTVYIYNMTDKKLIYSSNCQFGIKMPISTSNALEIERQKEASQLNLLMGMMTSVLSIGVGVASENPVAIAGGVLSAGKTIASFVNTNKQLFERAQTNFGTGEGLFHMPLSGNIVYRKTYNKLIPINEATFKHLEGIPYNHYVYNMTSLSGYVEVGDIHFDPKGENIYNAEIDEIIALLKSGVIM